LGHGFGIVGFLLMLSTESLYSLRKHLPRFTLGRMRTWLQIHVATGIVGGCLVLLHSGGKFHGLAGIVALLTVVIVASGFIGRYIYTAVPRTADGVEAIRELEEQILRTDRELQAVGLTRLGREVLTVASEMPPRGWVAVLGRGWFRWRHRQRLRRALGPNREKLEPLLAERYRLLMQTNSLAVMRRLLSLWHLAHVPLGVVLFTLAFLHAGAAMYYGVFLK
jgi:hypothetical protein